MARSVCPWRRNHCRKDSPVSRGAIGVKRRHTRGNRELVAQVEARSPQKRRRGVQRSGQRRRLDHRGTAARLEKSHPLVPANLVLDSDTPIELDQIRAAAEQNVLAVVHNLASARMLIGRCPAAQIGPALEEGDAKTVFRQHATGGQSRKSTPDARQLLEIVSSAPSSSQAFYQTLSQDDDFLADGEADLLAENVVLARLRFFPAAGGKSLPGPRARAGCLRR